MSRLTSRRRWLMAGPWPHPKTGILYYRKATPPDIFAARNRLREFGIKVTREVQRSLETKDKKPAERRYMEIAAEVEAEWDRWRGLLRDGPQGLSHRQRLGLAADHARAFLAKHEDEPFDAPPSPLIPSSSEAGDKAWLSAVERMDAGKREALVGDLKEFLRASGERRSKLAFRLIQKHPAIGALVGPDVAAGLEAMHGADTDEALSARGLHVDAVTRRLVNLEMTGFMGAAERGLEARRGGDYSPVEKLEAAPAFVASSPPLETKRADEWWRLETLLDHKAKTTSIRAKTVSDNRAYLRKFAEFLGHDDARRVTKDDVRRWRDSLMETGLSPKTITDKYLSAIRAALSHGVKEFDLPFNAASGLADNRPVAAPERSKGWSEEEAVQILKATFGDSTKALSEPHKRALFWMPWMLAYTGLRAAEVAQLRGRDVREEDGIPYLLINPEAGSTKSGKAWAVGVHKHLTELGLLDFIRGVGEGPLFYEPYSAGTTLKALKGQHRAKEAASRVGEWIIGEVGLTAPLGRPLHAFRHLFTSRSRLCGMNKEARDFMMGSGPVDAREGYGDWPPAVLNAEINKLPRFTLRGT